MNRGNCCAKTTVSNLLIYFDVLHDNKNNFKATQEHSECELEEGSLLPQLILFSAQLIAGVAQTLYFVLGVSYMDDNIKKSKMPALLSMLSI